MEETKKVFISYSHDSEGHKQWVWRLGLNLRNHGVDVVLDQWDVRLGDDLVFLWNKGWAMQDSSYVFARKSM